MSNTIKAAIQALKGRIADAYTAIVAKGGTLPATQDSANLPTAIASIPSGGGQDPLIVDAGTGISFYNDPVGAQIGSFAQQCKVVGGAGRKYWTNFFFGYYHNTNTFPDISEMDTSDGEDFYRFYWSQRITGNNRILPTIRVTSKAKRIEQMCYSNYGYVLDTTQWDCSGVTNATNFALYWGLCQSIIGTHTLDDVENGIVAMGGLRISLSLSDCVALNFASMLALANGVADMTGTGTTPTITFATQAWGALTVAQQTRIETILTSKNWGRA